MMDTGFKHSKALGQNFLRDTNLLDAIAADSGADQQDTVVEIGAGAGALTVALARRAGQVIAFEIDKTLTPILIQALQGLDNVRLVFGDFLKEADTVLDALADYRVAANLPYYITTPILFALMERDNPPKSITVMVQKEVGERLAAKPGDSDYGALTVMTAFYGTAKIVRTVRADMFTPRPKVDSCVVRIDKQDTLSQMYDRKAVARVVKSAFAMRRKTLANNLQASFGISKQRLQQTFESLNISPMARGETLDILTFARLSQLL